MEFYIIPDEEALSKCAWCQSHINNHVEVLGLGARLKPDVDLSEYESHCIQIGLVSEEKPVYMMVTAQGSEARSDGNDCMFLVCSEDCANKLKSVLEKEITLGKMFETVHLRREK
jgi:hypothetical protein